MNEMTPRIGEALAFAAEVHAGDARKGKGIPYLSHLLAVATIVMENGGDEDQVVAALLHDTAEDHGGEAMLARVEERFGPRVRAIVAACSDSLLAEGAEKQEWRPRKETYIEHLKGADEDALLVSCADKLHNARSILADYVVEGDHLWERFNAGPAEQLWYYESLAAVFRRRLPTTTLADDLTAVVAELRALIEAGP